MSTQLEQVSIVKKSNIYFNGKCVSHTLTTADGSRKTVGVIFPSTLRFNTSAAETMEIVNGLCNVRLPGSNSWVTYAAGQRFEIAPNSFFDIETEETIDYVCHFG